VLELLKASRRLNYVILRVLLAFVNIFGIDSIVFFTTRFWHLEVVRASGRIFDFPVGIVVHATAVVLESKIFVTFKIILYVTPLFIDTERERERAIKGRLRR